MIVSGCDYGAYIEVEVEVTSLAGSLPLQCLVLSG